MSLISLLNTYVINDISFIIYDYYYDSHKIKELKKDLLIEYHKKIYYFNSFIVYTKGYGISLAINYRFNKSVINNDTKIYRFDVKDIITNNAKYVAILPKNY